MKRKRRTFSIDLLDLLHSGKIDEDEADRLLDEAVRHAHEGAEVEWWKQVGLSPRELRARSAGLQQLARLRYDGWPEICGRCGRLLSSEQPFAYVDDHDGIPHLNHVPCEVPDEPGARYGEFAPEFANFLKRVDGLKCAEVMYVSHRMQVILDARLDRDRLNPDAVEHDAFSSAHRIVAHDPHADAASSDAQGAAWDVARRCGLTEGDADSEAFVAAVHYAGLAIARFDAFTPAERRRLAEAFSPPWA